MFLWGIVRRFWLLVPAFLLAPLDVLERAGAPVDIPIYAFYSALTAGLAAAAVLTYHEVRTRTVTLEDRVRPKLKVELDEPRPSPSGTRKWVRLHVTNEAHEQVRDCQGKLLEVKPLEQISVGLPDPEQNLMWSSRGGDAPDVRRSINAKSSEYLDVAFTEDFVDEYNAGRIQGTPEVRARVRQLLDDPFHSHFNFVFVDYRSWPLPKGGYEVTVEVSAANVGTPTRICFRIVYEGGLNLYPEAFDTADSSPIED